MERASGCLALMTVKGCYRLLFIVKDSFAFIQAVKYNASEGGEQNGEHDD